MMAMKKKHGLHRARKQVEGSGEKLRQKQTGLTGRNLSTGEARVTAALLENSEGRGLRAGTWGT